MLDPTKVYTAYTFQGKSEIDFDESIALSQLLAEGNLFPNWRSYTHDRDMPQPRSILRRVRGFILKKLNLAKIHDRTTVLYANCNDIFAWGCADAESIPNSEELKKLYDFSAKYPTWGTAIWCCTVRKERPQKPVEDAMKESNEWPEELMSTLNENCYDKACKKLYGNTNDVR